MLVKQCLNVVPPLAARKTAASTQKWGSSDFLRLLCTEREGPSGSRHYVASTLTDRRGHRQRTPVCAADTLYKESRQGSPIIRTTCRLFSSASLPERMVPLTPSRECKAEEALNLQLHFIPMGSRRHQQQLCKLWWIQLQPAHIMLQMSKVHI
ncbi:hypothetical protein MTO96_040253 [Rhipicephalus appendiculatus]